MALSIAALGLSKTRLLATEELGVAIELQTDLPSAVVLTVTIFGEGTIIATGPPAGARVVGNVAAWSFALPAGLTRFFLDFRTAARPYSSVGAVIVRADTVQESVESVAFFGLSSQDFEAPPAPPVWVPGGAVNIAHLWAPRRVEPGDEIPMRMAWQRVWGPAVGSLFTEQAITVQSGPLTAMELLRHNGLVGTVQAVRGRAGDLQGVWTCSVLTLITFRGEFLALTGAAGNDIQMHRIVGVGVDPPIVGPPGGPPGDGDEVGAGAGAGALWLVLIGLGAAAALAYSGTLKKK